MKYSKIILSLLCLAIVTGCKETKEKQELTQMEQVMSIHDEVMPKMGTLTSMAAKLEMLEDSTEMGIRYSKARTDLRDASKAMMDWMQGFGSRFDSDEIINGKALSQQKQQWLNEEEQKVKALRDQINSSIAKAEALLKESEE